MTTTAALVVDIVDLPRQIGSVKDVRVTTAAPADLGTGVIGVPEGSPVVLDVQLTSMEDGVLARGRADVRIHGRCVRCLRDLDEDRTVAFDEIYYLPQAAKAQAAEDDEEAGARTHGRGESGPGGGCDGGRGVDEGHPDGGCGYWIRGVAHAQNV